MHQILQLQVQQSQAQQSQAQQSQAQKSQVLPLQQLQYPAVPRCRAEPMLNAYRAQVE